MTTDCKCAFAAPMIAEDFRCSRGELVSRRGGPDVSCHNAAASQECAALLQRFKDVALPAFGYEDDLLTMPHSVLVKIQYGGLLGLQQYLDAAGDAGAVADIHALVSRASAQFQQVDAVPARDWLSNMLNFKVKRRRRKS